MSPKNKATVALGNGHVVEILEAYLAEARKGKLNYIALTATQAPNQHGIAIGGEVDMAPIAMRGLREVEQAIQKQVENGIMPPADEFLGWDYVCYNLAVCPVSFDFLYWLVTAEMARRHHGAPGPLKVQFWRGRDGIGRMNDPLIKRMFENALRPLVAMIGAVEIPAGEIVGRCPIIYSTREIVRGYKAGETVPTMRAPVVARDAVAQWLSDRGFATRPVTITLREAPYWTHRNSNLPEWLKFARYLRKAGEQVVFVRDTNKAGQHIKGEIDYPLAATDLYTRVALYEAAKFNFFVANGPGALSQFVDTSMAMFIPAEPAESTYFPNQPKFWNEQMAVPFGGQFPWFGEKKRLIWKPETCENMIEAWQQRLGALPDMDAAGITPDTKCLSVAESRKDTFGQAVTAPVARHG
jgi:hypothetical protein